MLSMPHREVKPESSRAGWYREYIVLTKGNGTHVAPPDELGIWNEWPYNMPKRDRKKSR